MVTPVGAEATAGGGGGGTRAPACSNGGGGGGGGGAETGALGVPTGRRRAVEGRRPLVMTGTGTESTISSITAVPLPLSTLNSPVGRILWPSTGPARTLTSSGVTKLRPFKRARA
jgi:hypothetical protein